MYHIGIYRENLGRNTYEPTTIRLIYRISRVIRYTSDVFDNFVSLLVRRMPKNTFEIIRVKRARHRQRVFYQRRSISKSEISGKIFKIVESKKIIIIQQNVRG